MGSGLHPPIPAHWSRESPLQYETHRRDPQLRCEFCVHAVFNRPRPRSPTGYSLSCGCPKCLPGQAGAGRVCCSFMRESGADDVLEGWPPLVPW